MNLLETIMSAQSGGVVKQLANNNGVATEDTLKALSGLIPGITKALGNNAQQSGGLEAIMGALQKGSHQRYLEDERAITQPDTITDGNKILGHLLGSKDSSRSLASQVANQTGLDSSLLKKMLPVVATLVMGAMSKQSQAGGTLSPLAQMLGGGQSSAPSRDAEPQSMLMSFLDMDNDGSVADDVMSLAAKFLF
ncbi:MAG: DUF937 domain-containing protein [bacterium]